MPVDPAKLTEDTLIEFCKEFVEHAYLCYTEHGLHALFFTQLYNTRTEGDWYEVFESEKLCLIQKEYPTHHNLGKSRRQHWDIAVIKSPIVKPHCNQPYDHLHLAAVVEFGLNCGPGHLADDIARLSHEHAQIDACFAVHLYRFSTPGNKFSKRDWSPASKSILALSSVQAMLQNRPPVTVYYGVADRTRPDREGLWKVTAQQVLRLYPEPVEVLTP